MKIYLLLAVLVGIVILLYLILRLKLPAFISLLIASICTALAAGMEPSIIMETIKNGMSSTLGFVAIVVGLGGIFGGILEYTGGASALAKYVLSKTGYVNAPWALLLIGFLIGIPVFFDVGFIILFPLIVALHHQTKLSILHYAVPLLCGLAVSHTFIPPTPGPLAVSEIIGAPLGYIVVVGIIVGIPSAILSGIVFGKYLGNRLFVQIPEMVDVEISKINIPKIYLVLPILLLPVIMIVFNSMLSTNTISLGSEKFNDILEMLCHPFSALIFANLCAWYILGRKAGFSQVQLNDITTKSLYPAGIIILVTGAGGVFKQVLIDTGAGKMIAEQMQAMGLSIIVFAFLASALIRILQGSATVAMITGAGLVAPLLSTYELNDVQLATIVISIASGSTVASHLNDSGFWLVKQYLGLSEKEGMKTWTVASSILGLTGFVFSWLIFYIY